MDLAEIVALRPVPCAGLLLTVTQRCPLRCAHCSSDSTMAGPAPDGSQLLRFVGSFSPADRPEVVVMTGGEPLLYPDLVAELALTARRAGARSAVLTGAYFAVGGRFQAPIRRAATAVDHFSVSIDVHHERHVRRRDAFLLLRRVLDAGVAVSLHVTGDGPDDPYLAELAADVRDTFGDQVPLLVNVLQPIGRAAPWAAAQAVISSGTVAPCTMAAWPVVTRDGTVTACCNQDAVDRRPVPEHLALGHISSDDWAAVRRRSLSSPVLRLVRSAGPVYLTTRLGEGGPDSGSSGSSSYCQTCRQLGERPDVLAAARAFGSGPAGELLDKHAAAVQYAAGPTALLRRHACAPYAHLVAPERMTDSGQRTEAS